MDKQQAKNILPIIQAFAEGKTIECFLNGKWVESINPAFNAHYTRYRIKPELKYRPFADDKECWEEMQKHCPFGWVKAPHGRFFITGIRRDGINFGTNNNWHNHDYIFTEYTFLDGAPFGIKVE